MSPVEIKIILHVYAIATDYRDDADMPHARSEAVRQTFEHFEGAGLIVQAHDDKTWNALQRGNRPSQFRTTDKGNAFVEAICAVQIPVIKWVQP